MDPCHRRRWTKELKALSAGTRGSIALSGRLKLRRLAFLVETQQSEVGSEDTRAAGSDDVEDVAHVSTLVYVA